MESSFSQSALDFMRDLQSGGLRSGVWDLNTAVGKFFQTIERLAGGINKVSSATAESAFFVGDKVEEVYKNLTKNAKGVMEFDKYVKKMGRGISDVSRKNVPEYLRRLRDMISRTRDWKREGIHRYVGLFTSSIRRSLPNISKFGKDLKRVSKEGLDKFKDKLGEVKDAISNLDLRGSMTTALSGLVDDTALALLFKKSSDFSDKMLETWRENTDLTEKQMDQLRRYYYETSVSFGKNMEDLQYWGNIGVARNLFLGSGLEEFIDSMMHIKKGLGIEKEEIQKMFDDWKLRLPPEHYKDLANLILHLGAVRDTDVKDVVEDMQQALERVSTLKLPGHLRKGMVGQLTGLSQELREAGVETSSVIDGMFGLLKDAQSEESIVTKQYLKTIGGLSEEDLALARSGESLEGYRNAWVKLAMAFSKDRGTFEKSGIVLGQLSEASHLDPEILLSLRRLHDEGIKSSSKEVNKGIKSTERLDKMVTKVNKSLTGVVKRITNMWEAFLIGGDQREGVVIPYLEKIETYSRSFIKWFDEFVGRIDKDTMKMAGEAAIVFTIATTLGSVALIVGGIVVAIGWIPLAIAVVIASIAAGAYYIYKYWDDIKSYMVDKWKGIQEFFTNMGKDLVDRLKQTWDQIKVDWNVWVDDLRSEFPLFTKFIETTWDTAVSSLKILWDSFSVFFKDPVGSVKAYWDGFVLSLELKWNRVVQNIKGTWNSVHDWLKGKFNELEGWVKSLFGTIEEYVPDWIKNQFRDNEKEEKIIEEVRVNESVGGSAVFQGPSVPSLDTGGEIVKDGMVNVHKAEVVVSSPILKELINTGKEIKNKVSTLIERQETPVLVQENTIVSSIQEEKIIEEVRVNESVGGSAVFQGPSVPSLDTGGEIVTERGMGRQDFSVVSEEKFQRSKAEKFRKGMMGRLQSMDRSLKDIRDGQGGAYEIAMEDSDFKGPWDLIKDFFENLPENVARLNLKLRKFVGDTVDFFKDTVSFFKGLPENIASIGGKVGEFFGDTVSFFKNLPGNLSSIVSDLGNWFGDLWQAIVNPEEFLAKKAGEKVTETVVTEAVTNTGGNVAQNVVGSAVGGAGAAGAGTAATTALGGTGAAAGAGTAAGGTGAAAGGTGAGGSVLGVAGPLAVFAAATWGLHQLVDKYDDEDRFLSELFDSIGKGKGIGDPDWSGVEGKKLDDRFRKHIHATKDESIVLRDLLMVWKDDRSIDNENAFLGYLEGVMLNYDTREKEYQRANELAYRTAMGMSTDIQAATGFSGLVTHPTRFLVGEAGPEWVEVTPLSRPSVMSSGMIGTTPVSVSETKMEKTDMSETNEILKDIRDNQENAQSKASRTRRDPVEEFVSQGYI